MVDTMEVRRKGDWSLKDVYDLCDELDAARDEIDRLRAPKPQPQGKTVRVKVAVAVDKRGYWRAEGRPTEEDILYVHVRDYMQGEHSVFWLTADLPIPEETTVETEVEGE